MWGGLQAEEFEAVVGQQFSAGPAAPCWYPGARARYEEFLIEHRGYELVAPTVPDGLSYSAIAPPTNPANPACAAHAAVCAKRCGAHQYVTCR